MADAAYLNRVNMTRILREIVMKGVVSRTDLAKSIESSIPTVTRIVDYLMHEEGLLKECGFGNSTGGRKPNLVSMNDEENFIIGIDLSPRETVGIITDIKAKVVSSFKMPTPQDTSFENMMERTFAITRTLMQNSEIDEKKILGIGIAVSGIINLNKNVIEFSPHYEWHNVDVVQEMEKYTKIPVVYDNISRLMAVGELYFGIGKRYDHFVCIKIGRGMGAGIVIERRPHYGAHGVSGEFGHTTVDMNSTLRCVCGRTGCMETVASCRGLTNQLRTAVQEGRDTSLVEACQHDLTNLNFDILAEEYDRGDEVARELGDRMIAGLAYGISNLVDLYNPEIVILGGDFKKSGEVFINRIRDLVHSRGITSYAKEIPIMMSTFGEEEIAMGGVALILEKVINREITRSDTRVRSVVSE